MRDLIRLSSVPLRSSLRVTALRCLLSGVEDGVDTTELDELHVQTAAIAGGEGDAAADTEVLYLRFSEGDVSFCSVTASLEHTRDGTSSSSMLHGEGGSTKMSSCFSCPMT